MYIFLSRLPVFACIAILIGATAAIQGCSSHSDRTLGTPPASAATLTVKEIAHAGAGKSVTLRGEMTEKCPVAGCWFMLKDKTGIVRVDTKASGFVVTDVPLHSTVTVSGTVVTADSPGITATGVRY